MSEVLNQTIHKINTGLLAGICLLFSSNVLATYEDITGFWSGNVSGTRMDFVSTPPFCADPGPFSATVSLEFSNQSGGTFSVSFSGVDNTTGTFFAAGNGTFLSATTLSFAVSSADGESITFTATLNENNLSLNFMGSDPVSNCDSSGNGSVTRISGDLVVNPAVTPGSTVTDAILFTTQIQGTISGISGHIASFLSGAFFGGPSFTDNQFKLKGATGLNAGDGASIPYGVWGNYAYTDFENDLSSTAFDGSSHSFLGGVDFAISENSVIGIAIGYDNGDIDTTFNSGNQESETFTIAPYFGALLTDSMSVDFNIGYSRVDYDQFRVAPGSTTRITSTPDSDRWFGAFNLNGFAYHDNWILGARVGALFASNVLEAYTESNGTAIAESRTKLGSASIAGDIAYSYKNYEPFVNLSYQYDFSLTEISVATGPQPTNDANDLLMTTGVRYFNNNGISGNIEYSKRFLRDNFDEDRISLTIRADF